MKNSKGPFAVISTSHNPSQPLPQQQQQPQHSSVVLLDSAQNFNYGLPLIEQSHQQHSIILNQNGEDKKMMMLMMQHMKNNNFLTHNEGNSGNSSNYYNSQMQQQRFMEEQQQFQDPMPEEEGFLKSILTQNMDDDLFDNFGSQMMIIGGGDDLNKIHKNFAGDTFSQISSTYEQQLQVQQQNQPHQNHLQQQQQSQNDHVKSSNKHSKLHSYHEKNFASKQQNNDELLDSAILNNLNEDLNSPKENNVLTNFNPGKNGNQVLFFNHPFPSPHYNHLNNIIMNSEQLQQSDVHSSTLTLYNSGIFDDASIMRILDKSISDDSLFFLQHIDDQSQQQQQMFHKISSGNGSQQQTAQMRNLVEMEQSFRFECEDVKSIMVNVSSKLKEKVQKQQQRNNQSSSSQLVAVQIEELKQLEIMSTSAIEKIRQIQTIGKHILESQKVKSLTFKNYKQNLKIQLHSQLQKFKELCRKQCNQAERQKFKYQINEYELNEKIKLLEERLERQSDDINKLANKNEQLKFEKKVIASKNDQKLTDIEKVIKVVMKTLVSPGDNENPKLPHKVNNSFCLGTDHSMLLQPPQSYKQYLAHAQDMQQSVDEKENESILSNTNNPNLPFRLKMKSHLKQLKRLVKENKQLNLQFKEEDQQPRQEGGSYYEQSSSILNLMGDLNIKRDSLIQQSQFIPNDNNESEADMNRAFIQSQESSQFSNNEFDKKNGVGGKLLRNIIEEDVDQSLEQFDEDHILLVMNGVNHNHEENDQSYLDDRISEQDLAGKRKDGISQSQRMIQEQQREQIMINQSNSKNYPDKFLNISNENSIDDDLNILKNLSNKQGIFPTDLSGFGGDFKQSMIQPSGRNIFIADEFTGGSIEFNSRNHDDKLYSGGSSQFSMIQAFQSLRGNKSTNNEQIVVKVQDRQITMPKLNLRRICENQGEAFKFNITNNSVSHTSSSVSDATLMIQSSKQQMISQPNITSFQNESISKQYQDMLINGSVGEGMLDQAVYIENNQNNNSAGSNKDGNGSAPGGFGFNMFDSFKKELEMSEKPSLQQQTQNNKMLEKNTLKLTKQLNLDESLFERQEEIKFNADFQQDLQKIAHDNYKHKKQDDKSIDLSLNISRFKKSQSDPNLMFNDLADSSDEEFQRNKETQDSKNIQHDQNPKRQPVQAVKFDFKKLKTPQAIVQNKIKINIQQQNNDTSQANEEQKPLNLRKSLGQFQAKIRSNSGNSRANNNESNNQEQKQSINNKPIIKIQKLNLVNKKDISQIVQREDEAPSMIQPKKRVNQSMQKIVSPDLINHQEGFDNNKIIKKIIAQKPKSIKREVPIIDDQLLCKEASSDTNNSQQKSSQIMQNYMVSAAAMSGITVHKPSGIKLMNPNRQKQQALITRNQQVAYSSNLSNYDQNDHSQIQSEKPIQILKIKDLSMMQEMKEYQESQDLSVNQGVLRNASNGKRVLRIDNNSREDDEINSFSPNKNPQRTSQSHTPQKKNLIVVNKQIIKGNPKVIKIQNQTETNNYEDIPQTKLVPSTISLKKISISKKRLSNLQNVTVINQSVDQSQLQGNNAFKQNASILFTSNIDSSLMINDISQIQQQPKFSAKIFKGKILKQQIISQQQQQTSDIQTQPQTSSNTSSTNATAQIANKNMISLLAQNPQQTQGQIKSFNKQMFQKFKNQQQFQRQHQQQQDIFAYNSNQSIEKFAPAVNYQSSSSSSQQQNESQQKTNHNNPQNMNQMMIQDQEFEKNYHSVQNHNNNYASQIDVKKVEENKIQKRRRDLLLKPSVV